ncbi:anthranilate synthase component I family protein [Streptomyces sp. G-G2]|uniref:anthranilate synthase component I family protein n=1 Tax=Streptomyces sp. G-G2 TaxID=3046201 RepID=UPI0024BAE902|nr:anthranilate synthase component I family protein [Streptomyces sp. G-G2]MDJ0381552.1 anthranilate synthase component I family protein [Streptomyces sp. G-G2]
MTAPVDEVAGLWAADLRAGVVPDSAAALALAARHAYVPLYIELLSDTLTPVTAFARLCGPDETGLLLESVIGTDATVAVARYSYIAHRTRSLPLGDGDPLLALQPLADRDVARLPGLPPFHGGAVGYLGYESARHFERLPAAPGPGPDMPESVFFQADDLVVFDHATRRVLITTLHDTAAETYEDAVARLSATHERLYADQGAARGAGHGGGPGRGGARPLARPLARTRTADQQDRSAWRAHTTEERFLDMVETAREYIRAGDVFQVVLSQRFSKPLAAEPLDVYRHLRAVNPSPYMFHLSLGGGRHVIGASPELLVKVEDGRAQTRPLAGTRWRGTDAATDAALEAELLADEKECAEHVMLVDLGRNDIGRIAAPGTVRVDRLMEVERYSHVMHLSSTVSGDLAEGRTPLDALRSTFPAGTVSGAPKIRAMEIIAELEEERRGVYGGALGFIGTGGDLDTAIALRTLVIADGRAWVQAGAGVVADSDPAAEYRETLNKAQALFAAVERAEASA